MRILFALTSAVALLLFVASTGAQPPPIRVGVLLALTGPLTSIGPAFEAGLNLYLQGNPQILGRRVNLIVEDTESTPEVAARKARKLAQTDGGVVAIVGAINSPAALAVSAVAKEAKIPYLEAFAMSDDLTTRLRHEYVFRASTSVSSEARLAARVISRTVSKSSESVKIGTVASDIMTTRAMMTTLVSELKKLSPSSPVVERIIPTDAADHGLHVQAIKAARLEVLVIALPPHLLKQYEGVDGSQLTLILGRVAGDARLGVVADDDEAENWGDGCDGDNCEEILKAHRKYSSLVRERAAGFAGRGLTLQGYLTMNLVAEAMKRGNSHDPKRLAESLSGLTLESPLGRLTMHAQTHELNRGLFFGRVVQRDGGRRGLGPDALYVIPR